MCLCVCNVEIFFYYCMCGSGGNNCKEMNMDTDTPPNTLFLASSSFMLTCPRHSNHSQRRDNPVVSNGLLLGTAT